MGHEIDSILTTLAPVFGNPSLKLLCRPLFSLGSFSPLLFPSVLLATFPQTRCSYFRCSDALLGPILRLQKRPSLSPSLPLLIAIYDEYDANMQNNLTVNTSLEEAGEEGREGGRKEGVIQMSALK